MHLPLGDAAGLTRLGISEVVLPPALRVIGAPRDTHMKTAHKIWIFSSAALVTTLLVGGLAFAGTRRVVAHLDRVADGEFPSLVALGDLESNHQLSMRALNALMIERADADVHKRSYDRLAHALEAMEGARNAFDALPHDPGVLATYEKVNAAYSAWRAGTERATQRAHEQDRLREATPKADPAALQAAADATFRAWQEAAKLERELTPSLQGPPGPTTSWARSWPARRSRPAAGEPRRTPGRRAGPPSVVRANVRSARDRPLRH